MRVHDSNVTYSFCTHFLRPIDDLDEVARALVRRRVASSVFLSSGTAIWLQDCKLLTTWWGARRIGESDVTQSWIPNSDKAYVVRDGYAAAAVLAAEKMLFHQVYSDQTEHLRAFGPACILRLGDRHVEFRPEYQLYSSGVVQVLLRAEFSDPCSLDEFIKQRVNLLRQPATSLAVSIGTLLEAERMRIAGAEKGVFHRLREFRAFEDRIQRGVVEAAAAVHEDDVEDDHVWAADVTAVSRDQWAPPSDLRSLFEVHLDAIASAVNLRSGRLRPAVCGRRSIGNHRPDFWSSRPTICLTNFDGQPDDFSSATPGLDLDIAEVPPHAETEALMSNLRPARDFLLFMTLTGHCGRGCDHEAWQFLREQLSEHHQDFFHPDKKQADGTHWTQQRGQVEHPTSTVIVPYSAQTSPQPLASCAISSFAGSGHVGSASAFGSRRQRIRLA